MPENSTSDGGGSLLDQLPVDRLREAGRTLLGTVADRAVGAALEQVEGLADRLSDVAENGGVGMRAAIGGGTAAAKGENPVMGAIKGGLSAAKDSVLGALGMGGNARGGGGSGKFKFMNVVEELDVGVPVRVAYDQWTLFADFPSFMKKVHTVEQESDEKTNWYAQVWWSKRSWQATIIEQVPDTHIIWRSTGAKGYVNGIVSFHELAPSLTRVLLVLEYYPVGLFEKTANIWRAVGRRARLEFKHYRRHVMVHTLLDREDLQGWRGEIRDSEVVETHEEALEREAEESEQDPEYDGGAEGVDEDPSDEDLDDRDPDGEDPDDEDMLDEDLDEPAADDADDDPDAEYADDADDPDADDPDVDDYDDADLDDADLDDDPEESPGAAATAVEDGGDADEGRRTGSRRRVRAGTRG